jgi:hypothetical protein
MLKTPTDPPYRIPLNSEQLILLGKITVLWGQIDESVNFSLFRALKVDPRVYDD